MIVMMKNVSCILDGAYILRNIDWNVRPGQHWAIIGLNGSGKTTLLKMINGYVFPAEGEMTVFGKSFGAYDWRNMRMNIGFISSSLQEKFYMTETAEDIVLSGMFATIGLYDRPAREHRRKALSLLQELNCGHTAKQRYEDLSQGEKQKVLIARALIRSPQLLILDEPCAALDIFSREHLLLTVEKLAAKKGGPSLLYVTHHVEEILPVFTHTMLLRRGEVHSAGTTRKVLTKNNLSAFFETPVDMRWHKNRPWIRL